ncbi:hypothetical protein D9758_008109 [Tetrapyrgos nigripes]|uniref:F-box domain-containing protein n=1 Tax=Tetrapyrgos nigripes TaxID=182062 RepID=A0A8H5LPQ3_9AGAR|nr:hypothetical protein D9758_008109 [Tetrapyrgos nigripes]
MFTTMHALFSIPELLCIIFQMLKKEDQRQCIVVCKIWSEVSLDLLWADVRDVKRLLNILAPVKMKYGEDIKYIFDSPPDHIQWTRFQTKYSHRIRSLRHYEDQKIPSLMDILTSFHASYSSPILPNLRKLHWYWFSVDPTLQMATTFIHRDIQCYHTDIGWQYHSPKEVHAHVAAIPDCMPALTALFLDGNPFPEYTETIVRILRALPYLTQLELPAYSANIQ